MAIDLFDALTAGSFVGSLFGSSGPSRTDAAIASFRQFDYQRELDRLARVWQDKWNKVAWEEDRRKYDRAKGEFRAQRLDANTQYNRSFKENQRQYETALQEGKRQFNEAAFRTIRNRVNDAKAAGIHPLYALGAQSPSPSPVSVVGAPGGNSYGSAGSSTFIPGQSGSGGGLSAVMSGESSGIDFNAVNNAIQGLRKLSPKERRKAAAAEAYAKARQDTELLALRSQADLDKANAVLAMARASDLKRKEGRANSQQDKTKVSAQVDQPYQEKSGKKPRYGLPTQHNNPAPQTFTDGRRNRWRVGAATQAETVEMQYGEAAAELYGLVRTLDDVQANILWNAGPKYDPNAAPSRRRKTPRRGYNR